MSKFSRRQFLKLSAIWSVVPMLPKGLSFSEEDVEEEVVEEDEDTSHPYRDVHSDSPYFCDGGVSLRYWDDGNIDVFVAREDD